MPSPPVEPPASRWRRLPAALTAVAVAAILAMPSAATAEPEPVPTGGLPTSGGGSAHQVTLLTGDVVMLTTTPDGRQSASVIEQAGPAERPPLTYAVDDQVYVMPAEVVPYVTSGVLDKELFNVTQLVEQGYHDQAQWELPLLLAAPEGETAQTTSLPLGVTQQRRLESINAVSITADKADIRSVWEALRGPTAAAADAEDAQLAGGGQVWLNGKVKVALEESVRHVGAPDAWETGLDGSGVTVAVLDTGYDPDHPDLAGQVVGARNFTDSPGMPGEEAVDRQGHGTHVASTIAGTGAASSGARRGVAPGADLLVGKVLDDGGSGTVDWIIAGMEWAVREGAQVVNMSLGGAPTDGTDPLSLAVNQLTEETGALFVIAAGNSGPGGQTISSPGAADRALTVGATTKDDQPAVFSSRGPRLGDHGLKPEIVAPGVDIGAALAAEAPSFGSFIDEFYASASGTSMASPHVAGAAAIIAQQYPDLDADGIRARLVSTSHRLGEPVSFQGAGRLDVAAAVDTRVSVDHGHLSLGRLDQSGTVTRTLTYRNTSDQTVTLRLSADVTSTGSGKGRKPVLTLQPAAVTIPPDGERSVEVELNARATAPGGYAGHITARDQRDPATRVHTVVSASVDGPSHTLTVNLTGRDGEPTPADVYVWNVDTGELHFGLGHLGLEGTASFVVPSGKYSVVAYLWDLGNMRRGWAVAGDPELSLDRDVTLEFDARDGEPVQVTTPRDSDPGYPSLLMYQQVGDRTFTSGLQIASRELFLVPSHQVRTGVLETVVTWTAGQPLLTAHVGGPSGFGIQPAPSLVSSTGLFGEIPVALVGEASLPIVYAGTGTPEEFSQIDAAGKIALVTRHTRAGGGEEPPPRDESGGRVLDDDERPIPPLPPPTLGLSDQAAAAAEAGVELLLVHDEGPQDWFDVVFNAPLPVYTVDERSGLAIREALTNDPGLAVDLTGIDHPEYNYILMLLESGRIPAGLVRDIDERSLAVVESDYRMGTGQSSSREDWIGFMGSSPAVFNRDALARHRPVQRTEYVTAEPAQWHRLGLPHPVHGAYLTVSALDEYRAGETRKEVWWGPLVYPGGSQVLSSEFGAVAEQLGAPVARFHDSIRVFMLSYLYDNGRMGGFHIPQFFDIPPQFGGDQAELTLRRNGQVVDSEPDVLAQFTVPAEEADYELELVVENGPGNWAETSVRTESTWRFRSGRPADGRQVLPLVQPAYHLEAGGFNDVPAGTEYPLLVEPRYQPGADGPGGFDVAMEVSYDDAARWQQVSVAPAGDGMFEASIPAASPGDEFASVRITTTDADGNSLTQVIERAWRIAAS